MSTLLGSASSLRSRAYQAFKYSVYLLLTLNVILFFLTEWKAAEHLYAGSVPFTELIQYFTASIDTFNWVILLLLYELETYVIPEHKLTQKFTIRLNLLRGVCYTLIIYSLYGYTLTWLDLYNYHAAVSSIETCQQLGAYFMTSLDEYSLIDAGNCASLGINSDLFVYPASQGNLLTNGANLHAIKGLAFIDVINAAAWLLVVLILEIDVNLQNRGLLTGSIDQISKYTKFVLYSILFCAAVYWGITGSFLSFWDAFLWLAAFIFIEMNFMKRQEETENELK